MGWKQADFDAWLGMSIHMLDVKQALIMSSVKTSKLHQMLREFTDPEEKARYWEQLKDTSEFVNPVSNTTEQLAAAFNCNYKDDFRLKYLETVFPGKSSHLTQRWVPPGPIIG